MPHSTAVRLQDLDGLVRVGPEAGVGSAEEAAGASFSGEREGSVMLRKGDDCSCKERSINRIPAREQAPPMRMFATNAGECRTVPRIGRK